MVDKATIKLYLNYKEMLRVEDIYIQRVFYIKLFSF